jgi:hypothetical protein
MGNLFPQVSVRNTWYSNGWQECLEQDGNSSNISDREHFLPAKALPAVWRKLKFRSGGTVLSSVSSINFSNMNVKPEYGGRICSETLVTTCQVTRRYNNSEALNTQMQCCTNTNWHNEWYNLVSCIAGCFGRSVQMFRSNVWAPTTQPFDPTNLWGPQIHKSFRISEARPVPRGRNDCAGA